MEIDDVLTLHHMGVVGGPEDQMDSMGHAELEHLGLDGLKVAHVTIHNEVARVTTTMKWQE
jgi:hypothetical protein